MAISHICLTCGLDLARTRARVDAALKLPIVTCRECGQHCVRRRHPIIAGWRRGLRTRQAFWALIGQLALAYFLAFVIGALCRLFASEMITGESTLATLLRDAYRVDSGPGYYHLSGISPFQASLWIIASIVAGIWLGSAFPHWRLWRILCLWALWLLTVTSVEFIVVGAFMPIAWLAGATDYWRPDGDVWPVTAQVAMASFVLTVIATPLGRPARFLWKATVRKRWRKRLNRVRNARSGA